MAGTILEEFLKAAWLHRDLAGIVLSQEALQEKLAALSSRADAQINGFVEEASSLLEIRALASAQANAATEVFKSTEESYLVDTLKRFLPEEDLRDASAHLAKRQELLADVNEIQTTISRLVNTPALLGVDDGKRTEEIAVKLKQALSHQDEFLKKLNEVLLHRVTPELPINELSAQENLVEALEPVIAEAKKKITELDTTGRQEIENIVLNAATVFLSSEEPMQVYIQKDLIKYETLSLFKKSLALMQKVADQHKSLSLQPEPPNVQTAGSSSKGKGKRAASTDLSAPSPAEEKSADEMEKTADEIIREILDRTWKRNNLKSVIAKEKAFLNELMDTIGGNNLQIDPPPGQSYPEEFADIGTRITNQTEALETLATKKSLQSLNELETLESELTKLLPEQDLPQTLRQLTDCQKSLTEANDQQKTLLQLSRTGQPMNMDEARRISQSVAEKLKAACEHRQQLISNLTQACIRVETQPLSNTAILTDKDAIITLHETLARAQKKNPKEIEEAVMEVLSHFAQSDPIRAVKYEAGVKAIIPQLFEGALGILQHTINQYHQQITSKLPDKFTLSADCIGKLGDRIFLPPLYKDGSLNVCEVNYGIARLSNATPREAKIVPEHLMPNFELDQAKRFAYQLKKPQAQKHTADGSKVHKDEESSAKRTRR